MYKYLEAPNDLSSIEQRPALFLAGGITGCPNWQWEVMKALNTLDVTVLNPRRKNFPMDDPEAALWQITWEHNALRVADAILFWFCKETIQPIVLYELGVWTGKAEKPLFIGMHSKYPRCQDVKIQTRLVYPNTTFSKRLPDLIKRVRTYVEHF